MPDFVSDALVRQINRLQEVPATAPLLARGEKLLSPAAAAKASNVPGHRGGAHLNGSTVFRHITRGVRAANGEVIRLEGIRAGSRWLTSVEAIARFCERLTAAELQAAEASPVAPPSPRQRTRQQQSASKQLDALLSRKG